MIKGIPIRYASLPVMSVASFIAILLFVVDIHEEFLMNSKRLSVRLEKTSTL
jgi:hypothetical protein